MTQEISTEQARKVLGDLVLDAERASQITILTRYGRPAAAIVPLSYLEQTMTTTTSYGTWYNHDHYSLTVEQSVEEAFGAEGPEGFDVDAITADYREAVNAALPSGVTLAGDEFYGPYYEADRNFGDAPTDEYGALDIGAILEGIDLWAIIERHQTTP